MLDYDSIGISEFSAIRTLYCLLRCDLGAICHLFGGDDFEPLPPSQARYSKRGFNNHLYGGGEDAQNIQKLALLVNTDANFVVWLVRV